jgi:hypothetical protein
VVKEPQVSKEQWNGLQEVLVYPNPNHGHFVVSAKLSNLNEVKIELMNSVGQKVYENKLGMVSSFKQTVDVKDLAAGIYYLKISSPDGFVTLKLAIH